MSKEDLIEIIVMGYDVWSGDYNKLIEWLNTPCKAMGGNKPIEYTKEEIITVMTRIEHGVYS